MTLIGISLLVASSISFLVYKSSPRIRNWPWYRSLLRRLGWQDTRGDAKPGEKRPEVVVDEGGTSSDAEEDGVLPTGAVVPKGSAWKNSLSPEIRLEPALDRSATTRPNPLQGEPVQRSPPGTIQTNNPPRRSPPPSLMPPPPPRRAQSTSTSPTHAQQPRNSIGSPFRLAPPVSSSLSPSFSSSVTLAQARTPSKSSKARRPVRLAPGHSPLDWARLEQSGTDLRGVPYSDFISVTPSTLRLHNKVTDAWTALGGRVYNITPYLPFHPGGEAELMRAAGRDGTKLLLEVHPWVSWDSMLKACLIGIFIPENHPAAATAAAAAASAVAVAGGNIRQDKAIGNISTGRNGITTSVHTNDGSGKAASQQQIGSIEWDEMD